MTNFLSQPWPWYITGPLIGLMVPLLLLSGNKAFGISSSMRHICAACLPIKPEFFRYNWRSEIWNLYLAFGIIIGGFIAGYIFGDPLPVQISSETQSDLNALNIVTQNGLAPSEIFSFDALLSLRGFIFMIVGGFLVGFGTRYAGGCTSGHSIMGISNLQLPSLIATCCFFAGGLLMTWVIFPYLLKL